MTVRAPRGIPVLIWFKNDLYNTFIRRGAELKGQLFWEKQLAEKSLSRDQLRTAFLASPEFQKRVAAVAGLSCMP